MQVCTIALPHLLQKWIYSKHTLLTLAHIQAKLILLATELLVI